MIIKEERYVITTKEFPLKFEADSRIRKFTADENNVFYRTGDLTEYILEAYKWETEEDAKEYMENTKDSNDNLVYSPEEFEIRKVVFSCEIE